MRIRGAEVFFRYALPGDAVPLAEFAARVYYETFISSNTPENMEAYLADAFSVSQFRAEIGDPSAVFILAEVGKELTGYAKLFPAKAPECVKGEAPIELVRFYIDSFWHGSGLATVFMDLCLAEARQRGFKTMYLGVWEKNFRAQAFYRKWNFERVGEHIFQMGDDPQTDWWMTRAILPY